MEAEKLAVESVNSSAESNVSSLPTERSHAENLQANLANEQLGEYRVIRRNGKVTSFDAGKISVAMTKAFIDVEGGTAAASTRIHETVETLSVQVVNALTRRMSGGGTVHIEDIQDQVELALMRAGEQKVARAYVIYREERARERAAVEATDAAVPQEKNSIPVSVTLADGAKAPLDIKRLKAIVAEACKDLGEVDGQLIIQEALRNLFDGINETDVNSALVMSARVLIEKEPNYSYAAAGLLLDSLRHEALSFIEGKPTEATHKVMKDRYPIYFKKYIKRGAELGLLDHE